MHETREFSDMKANFSGPTRGSGFHANRTNEDVMHRDYMNMCLHQTYPRWVTRSVEGCNAGLQRRICTYTEHEHTFPIPSAPIEMGGGDFITGNQIMLNVLHFQRAACVIMRVPTGRLPYSSNCVLLNMSSR